MSNTSLTSASNFSDVAPVEEVTDAEVAAVRDFNRFYTNVLGLLREGLLDTPYSLTEARIIFELARADQTEAGQLRRWLDIDAGYLSRVLARFETDGIVSRSRSAQDGRRQVIGLTATGRAVFAKLDALSAGQIRGLLGGLPAGRRAGLLAAMAGIREALEATPRHTALVLRAPLPGELGWVVQRNAALYAAEYGWDESYEALVARIVADYAARADHKREAAWIAEVDGRPAGCVFCMHKTDDVAQLRLLLVEPHARGMGIGERLVADCVAFAQRSGYRELVLWTNDVLHAARRIYQRAGFELVDSREHHSFGHDLVGQDWRLSLA
jgi:DNA-binding MarR family transcriptional regulator/N-acetylglutamate synthase-like GNAT family acetyltransferase